MKQMTERFLTDALAERVMGWKPGPDRFIKSGRGWIPRRRFRPFEDLSHAFQLLDHAACAYTLSKDGDAFTAEIRAAPGVGMASDDSKARTITLAIARALGIEVEP